MNELVQYSFKYAGKGHKIPGSAMNNALRTAIALARVLVCFVLPYPRVQSHKVMGKDSEDACNRLYYRRGSISLKSINFFRVDRNHV